MARRFTPDFEHNVMTFACCSHAPYEELASNFWNAVHVEPLDQVGGRGSWPGVGTASRRVGSSMTRCASGTGMTRT